LTGEGFAITTANSPPCPEGIQQRIGGAKMQKFVCFCGYVYDPAIGGPGRGIPPGTPFDNLPDTWTCPDCGAKKEQFSLEG